MGKNATMKGRIMTSGQEKNPRFENLTDSFGIDTAQPRLRRQLSSGKRGIMRTAYEIKAGNKNDLSSRVIWGNGEVSYDQPAYIPSTRHHSSFLKSYYWQVRVWGNIGNTSTGANSDSPFTIHHSPFTII